MVIKSHGRRAGQPMHDADQQRPKRLIVAQAAKGAIQPALRRRPIRVDVSAQPVRMDVGMDAVSVAMRMSMDFAGVAVGRSQRFGDPSRHAG